MSSCIFDDTFFLNHPSLLSGIRKFIVKVGLFGKLRRRIPVSMFETPIQMHLLTVVLSKNTRAGADALVVLHSEGSLLNINI